MPRIGRIRVLNSLASADLAGGGGRKEGKMYARRTRGYVTSGENDVGGKKEREKERVRERERTDTHLRFARPWPRVNVAINAQPDRRRTRLQPGCARMHINRGDIICLIRQREKGKRSAFRRRQPTL